MNFPIYIKEGWNIIVVLDNQTEKTAHIWNIDFFRRVGFSWLQTYCSLCRMQDCGWSQNLLKNLFVPQCRSTSVIRRVQEGLESDHEYC